MPPSARDFALRRESQPTTVIAPSNRSRFGAGHPNFRTALGQRNIYIADEDPPTQLLTRATKIISEPHESSEMDDATALELRRIAKSMATEGEDTIIRKLGDRFFPSMNEVPDQKLAVAINKVWDDAVAIPLHPSVIATIPPLPRPKPDFVFGYSDKAFNRNQLEAINHLSNELGHKYAMPAKNLRFPFLEVELKALATGGNVFVAENQAANGGAIAMNGLLELNKRNSTEPNLDSDSPQFFSVTMNNRFASVNAHWLSQSAEDGSICYHMATLSDYLLTESGGLKTVHQIVKNILDYAVNKRLPMIREALDIYRQKVVIEPEKFIHGRDSSSESQAEEQISPRQSGTTVHPSADQQPAKRRKLRHPTPQLQSGRATRTKPKNRKGKHHLNASSAIPVRASIRIARRGQS